MRRSALRFWLCLLAALSPLALLLPAAPSGAASVTTVPSNCVPTGAVVRCTFAYNGTNGSDGTAQRFVVPPGVRSVTLEAWGAAGGGPPTTFPGVGTFAGGLGGHARGTFRVVPGMVLWVRVGGQGGFNGGGAGSFAGGGASDVRAGGTTLAARVVVAGGGGGEGHARFLAPGLDVSLALPGGPGGGPAGGAGVCDLPLPDGTTFHVDGCGGGGTATSGGAGGSSPSSCFVPPTVVPAGAGVAGAGGNGAIVTCDQPFQQSTSGAGGGGGSFGGGGGAADVGVSPLRSIGGAGGGGSGFVRAGATGVVNEAGVRGGNGQVGVSYARTPSNVRDCLHGGWRSLVDDQGRPFRNVGRCIVWVVLHRH